MYQRQVSTALRRSKPRCRRCGRFKGNIYTSLCEDCVEQTLKQKLPRLQMILEERYGKELDGWLSRGSFTDIRWGTSNYFSVNERLIRRFLSKLIEEAAEDKDIWLESSDHLTWTPTRLGQLVSSIYEKCGAQLSRLIVEQVMEAMAVAPTEQAERELMALLNGKLQPERIEVLEEAVYFVGDSTSSGLSYEARMLLELRYKPGKDHSIYTEVSEGQIDEVWREIAEELPKSIQKLLPET